MREEFKRELLEEIYKVGYRFLTTDYYGNDCVFLNEPERDVCCWFDEARGEKYLPFSLGLTSWREKNPKRIAEILGINEVDWSQVPKDTKILVSYDNKEWLKRYFAKYENGKVYAWVGGLTSWTTDICTHWVSAKLAED